MRYIQARSSGSNCSAETVALFLRQVQHGLVDGSDVTCLTSWPTKQEDQDTHAASCCKLQKVKLESDVTDMSVLELLGGSLELFHGRLDLHLDVSQVGRVGPSATILSVTL